MFESAIKSEKSLNEIIESLSITEDAYDAFYQTRSREDYNRLLDAALRGNLEGLIAVGHTAIYRDKLRVSPPAEVGN